MRKDSLKALVVDDDDEDVLILRRHLAALKAYDVDLVHVRHERGLLEAVKGNGIDIVLLDLNLNGSISGLQLLDTLQAVSADVPTIIVTGTGDEEKAVQAMKSGAYDYLVKDDLCADVLEHTFRNVIARYDLEQERARMVTRLAELSVTDELTGLANRRRLEQVLEEEAARSARTGRVFAVLMLDMDHFKDVNDTFGHQVGDDILRRCGELLRENVRASDFIARYGGEEFCAVLRETTVGGARLAAERLRQALGCMSDPMPTVSIRVAVWNPGTDWQQVLGEADEALYAAKRAGRNRVAVHGDEETSDPS